MASRILLVGGYRALRWVLFGLRWAKLCQRYGKALGVYLSMVPSPQNGLFAWEATVVFGKDELIPFSDIMAGLSVKLYGCWGQALEHIFIDCVLVVFDGKIAFVQVSFFKLLLLSNQNTAVRFERTLTYTIYCVANEMKAYELNVKINKIYVWGD